MEQIELSKEERLEHVGIQKDESGFYSFRLVFNTQYETQGIVFLRLSDVPEHFVDSWKDKIVITADLVKSGKISLPKSGGIIQMEVTTLDVGELIIVNLTPSDISISAQLGIPHVLFAQIAIPKTNENILANKPGEKYFLTWEINEPVVELPADDTPEEMFDGASDVITNPPSLEDVVGDYQAGDAGYVDTPAWVESVLSESDERGMNIPEDEEYARSITSTVIDN